MLIIVHENAKNVQEIFLNDRAIPKVFSSLTAEFWRLAKEYPHEILIWIDNRFTHILNKKELKNIFHHELIMASYPVKEQFFPPTIGYIDQLPFVKPDYNVKYPTWRMSTNVGGLKGGTALEFQQLVGKNVSFGYLINVIAKTGQQNSLFCYSEPALILDKAHSNFPESIAKKKELFQFVYQFYKTEWLLILLFCYMRYENKFPLLSFLAAFLKKKRFKAEVDLSKIEVNSSVLSVSKDETIDVIIPTLKRPEFVKLVLEDIKKQSKLPQKVIIIEQDPDKGATSQLKDLLQETWPFEVVHKFITTPGACKARNLAMEYSTSKWIFFADDDIRIPEATFENAISEIKRLGIKALNLNCVQLGADTVFHKTKQWGAFGSGTSIVASEHALKCRFNDAYEYGFGEDTDFGLQLRAKGADIIYHPKVQITHLKAERGGFRQEFLVPWEKEKTVPKPSPTMMLLVQNYHDKYMLRGYKISLFLKYYTNQPVRNPFKYLKVMEQKWNSSKEWAIKLSPVDRG